MKKLVLFAFVLVLFAACHENSDRTLNLNSSVASGFRELIIDFGQAVSPTWVNEVIVVRASPQIERVITAGTWDADADEDKVKEVCKATVPLKLEEYDEIVALVEEASLEVYAPSEECDEMVGASGITISYETTDGGTYGFHTMCELEPQIDALVKEVEELADAAIPDCNIGMAEGVFEDSDEQ